MPHTTDLYALGSRGSFSRWTVCNTPDGLPPAEGVAPWAAPGASSSLPGRGTVRPAPLSGGPGTGRAAVGTRLSADCKEYVHWFGPGDFAEYLIVCVPGAENSDTEPGGSAPEPIATSPWSGTPRDHRDLESALPVRRHAFPGCGGRSGPQAVRFGSGVMPGAGTDSLLVVVSAAA
ncbi:hypothetical protein ACR6C2_30190 [Streptomyces sp. INA 01156]